MPTSITFPVSGEDKYKKVRGAMIPDPDPESVFSLFGDFGLGSSKKRNHNT